MAHILIAEARFYAHLNDMLLAGARAVREDGAERRVEGKATPINRAAGKIKVRVFYSKRIELIFNTTYRFPDVPMLRAAEAE